MILLIINYNKKLKLNIFDSVLNNKNINVLNNFINLENYSDTNNIYILLNKENKNKKLINNIINKNRNYIYFIYVGLRPVSNNISYQRQFILRNKNKEEYLENKLVDFILNIKNIIKYEHIKEILDNIKRLGGCKKRSTSILIEKNNMLYASYNHTPIDKNLCRNNECLRCKNLNNTQGQNYETCICIHAEESICLSLKEEIKDSYIYTSLFPCYTCSRQLLTKNIKALYYFDDFITSGEELFIKANIPVYKIIIEEKIQII